jgi:hypothetical protein
MRQVTLLGGEKPEEKYRRQYAFNNCRREKIGTGTEGT